MEILLKGVFLYIVKMLTHEYPTLGKFVITFGLICIVVAIYKQVRKYINKNSRQNDAIQSTAKPNMLPIAEDIPVSIDNGMGEKTSVSKFCMHCGAQFGLEDKFCSGCGKTLDGGATKNVEISPVVDDTCNISVQQTTISLNKNNKHPVKFILLLIIVIVIGTGGYCYYEESQEDAVTAQHVAPSTKQVSSSNGQTADKSSTHITNNNNQLITKTQKLINNKKIAGNVVGTSLGHNNDGTLALIKTRDEFKFIIIDNIDNIVAEVPFSTKAYNLDQSTDETIIFAMTVYNDTKGKDRENGIWNGNDHLIPVYAAYKIEENNVVPGMLSTGWGAKPSHYQGYFYEQKNVNLANLFLTEMKALRSNCLSNNVIVPSK